MSTTLILGLAPDGDYSPIKVNEAGELTTITTVDGSISVDNFPTNQTINGSVSVSNFPTTTTVSNFPASQTINGSVSVSNFPVSTEVSNFPTSTEVSNFPTSTEISNFPASQTINGSVSVSNFPASTEVSNFPASQTINGSISVSNFPVSTEVSNFPTSTEVSNFPTSTEISNFPASQTINGSVSVSNFPTSTEVSNFPTSTEISNFPASQTINGSVSVSNFPTSTEVSNFPTSTEISNFPASQTINGSVSVSNFPASTEISNFPASQTINGSVSVSNFPASQTINGSVNVAALPAINITNTSFNADLRDGDAHKLSSTVYGIDGVRALDVSIKNATQADPLNCIIDTTAALNCQVNNFPSSYEISVGGSSLSSVASALYTNLRDATGSAIGVAGAPLVVESNLISGFSTESTLVGVKGQTDKFKFNGDNLKTEITNAIIAVETGTNALDVNIVSGSGSNGKAYLYSGDETKSITATTVSSKNGIDSNIINTVDTASSIYGNFGATKTALTCDGSGQLYTNSSISGGFINIKSSAGQTIGSDVVNQSLNVNIAAIENNGSALVNKLSYTNKSTNKKALDCEISNSYIVSRVNDGSGNSIGSTGGGLNVNVNNASLTVYDAQTVDINSTLTTLNNKIPSGLSTTTNLNSETGLKIYSILPKMATYYINGNSLTGGVGLLGYEQAIDITTVNFGLANPKSYYGYTAGANRTLYYEYIDNTGAVGTNSIALTNSVWSGALPLQGGGSGVNKIVSINKWYVSPSIATGSSVYIGYGSSGATSLSVAGGNNIRMYNGVFTCPPNAKAFITSLSASISGTGADSLQLHHWDVNGNRTGRYSLLSITAGATAITATSGNMFSGFGGEILSGESVAWSGSTNATSITARNIFSTIQVFYY